MKRFYVAALAALCLAGRAHATSVAFNTTLANNKVVSSTTNFVLDASQNVVDLLSIQVALSTASPATATFKDGKISGASIKVTSATFLTAQAGQDTITVTTNSALSPTAGSDSILVSSGVAGSSVTVTTNKAYVLRDGNQYTSANQSTGQTATLLAAAINTYVSNVTAAVSGSSVIITCNSNGAFCNSYALSSTTSTALTAASAHFSGGNDNATFNLNGDVYYQGSDWFQADTASGTAISILNALTSAAFSASTNTTTSVLIKCAVTGSFCNQTTLTASTGALTIASAKFTGGQDPFILAVNGTKMTAGTDFTAGSSSASAANAIAAAMNANSAIGAITTSTAPLACGLTNPCGVVNSSGIITTGNNNYTLYATSGVTLSSATYLSGVASAYAINSPLIALPSHGMATNMQVLYTSGTVTVAPLVNQTTYYVIAVDANDIYMSLTSTGAIAGTFITLTSTPAVGGHSFTLAPLAMTGSTVVTLQASNDNVNWSNLSVSASTIAANGAASSTLYDLGATNLAFYRANVAAAPTGGTNVTIRAFGKRYGLGL